MNKLATLGLISLVGALGFACGDDDDPVGAAGSAGTGGSGGSGGSAGMNMGGMGGSEMITAACSDCVELMVPFANASEAANYQFNNSPPVDFTSGVVTWSVMVSGGSDATFLKLQLQNGADQDYAGYYDFPAMPLTEANFPAETWVDISIDASTIAALVAAATADAGTPSVADAGAGAAVDADAGASQADASVDADAAVADPVTTTPSGFDKSVVDAIALQVGSTAGFTGTQDVVVLVQSVSFTGVPGLADVTFTADASGLTLNNYDGSPTPTGTPDPVHIP